MPLFEIILLCIAIALLSYLYFKKPARKKEVPDQKYMMVVMRRREVGLKRSLELSREEHEETNAALEKQWRIVHERWIGLGVHYLNGFASDAAGLPAPGDQDWRLFFLYGLSDYTLFRKCVEVLEAEGNNLLRHHIEIRLLPGESMIHVGNRVKRIL
jgi:hypothetical protein